MPRNGEDARRRLQEAALALYRKHGYDATTTAQIAAEAGVTERTFFRHFADKREVLFDGEDAFRATLRKAVADVPGSPTPLATLLDAFRALIPMLEGNRPFSEPRFRVIAETPALRERELAKGAAMIDAVAEALTARGVPERQAALAARVGMTAFDQAAHRWLEDPGEGAETHLTRAFDDLRGLWAAED